MPVRHHMPTQLCAVVHRRGKVLLGRRGSDQRWELPGGEVDTDAPDAAGELVRLVRAATGQAVVVGPEVYDTEICEDRTSPVRLIAFGCHLDGRLPLQISARYRQVAWLPVDELPRPNLAPGAENAVRAWVSHPTQAGTAAPEPGIEPGTD